MLKSMEWIFCPLCGSKTRNKVIRLFHTTGEMNLLKEENEKSVKEIRNFLEEDYESEEIQLSSADLNEWLKIASEDILIAKYVFESVDGEDLDNKKYYQ